jgi:hypothetical protein
VVGLNTIVGCAAAETDAGWANLDAVLDALEFDVAEHLAPEGRVGALRAVRT